MPTPISANDPLNLWLANEQRQLLTARLQLVEQLLSSSVGSADARIAEALRQIGDCWSRLAAANAEDSYECAVEALTRSA